MSQALANVQYKPTELSTTQLGDVMVKSGFFQDTRDAAQAIVKMLAGAELGFGPIASMQGVYIVKGRVTLAANLVGAAIQRSNKYRYRVTRLDNEACALTFYSGGNEIGESTFTMDDAKAAGIASDTYRKFPRNMLFSRALTNGARWYCPEVFNGPVYTPDELGAPIDDEGRVVEVHQAARVVPTRERNVEDRQHLLRAGAIAQEALEEHFGTRKRDPDTWTECANCRTPQECYDDGEAFVCKDMQACTERAGTTPAPIPQKALPTREKLTDRYAELIDEATKLGIPLDAEKWGIGESDDVQAIAEKGARLRHMIYGDPPKPKRAA